LIFLGFRVERVYDMDMFAALVREVRNLVVPADPAALVGLLELRDAVDAAVSSAVAEFDEAELWDLDGATSMTAWLRDRGGLTRRDAVHDALRAKRLRGLPVMREAWSDGSLSGGQVDAVLAKVGRHLDRFAEHEASIVPTLVGLSVDDTARAMERWRGLADADDDLPDADEPERSLHVSRTLDDRVVLDGDLDPELGALVQAGLRLAETRDLEGEPARTPAERRADALGDVFRFYLDNQQTRSGGRHRPHLNVIVTLEGFEAGRSGGRFVDGPMLPRSSVEQLLCDCTVHRVVMGPDSTIIDYGRATRTVPAPQWAALVVRDERCRFPGCDRPAAWCDGHHVVYWEHDGETNLDNLVLLCRRHHRRLHKPGWHAKLLPDGELQVTDPSGVVRTTYPPSRIDQLWSG
jgi:hypothetical protein